MPVKAAAVVTVVPVVTAIAVLTVAVRAGVAVRSVVVPETVMDRAQQAVDNRAVPTPVHRLLELRRDHRQDESLDEATHSGVSLCQRVVPQR